jgi:hypothetical protein
LKEGLKGVKVRFRRKNMLGEGRTGICCSLNGARSVIGILGEHPVPIFRKQGHRLILQVIVEWSGSLTLPEGKSCPSFGRNLGVRMGTFLLSVDTPH